jgi:Sigma-70 region 2
MAMHGDSFQFGAFEELDRAPMPNSSLRKAMSLPMWTDLTSRGMSTAATFVTDREEELFQLARRGDERAYGELVEAHRSALHAHCYRMLGSLEDADDALQETLLRAWRGLERF